MAWPLIGCYIIPIVCSLMTPYVLSAYIMVAVIIVACWKIGKIKVGKFLLDKSLPERDFMFRHYSDLLAEARNHQLC